MYDKSVIKQSGESKEQRAWSKAVRAERSERRA